MSNFPRLKISLFAGGAQHYESGLVSGLLAQNVLVDVIGGSALAAAAAMKKPGVAFYSFHGELQADTPVLTKARRIIGSYFRILRYAATTDSRLFHIQWPYKLVFFDRSILLFYYKALGKRIVYTAHNIDQDLRDGTHSWRNRVSLRILYATVDHIIVHTELMKTQLVRWFEMSEQKISVVPHGIMSEVPESALTRDAARAQLNLSADESVLLFFGLISPYKGLEHLVRACGALQREGKSYRLVIAGRIKECENYWSAIEASIDQEGLRNSIQLHLAHIPDEQVEVYFKAADVLVLPYNHIFQTGVLFLAYRFGLPVIASDVGSIKEDIIPGKTGLLCRPRDPLDLARAIEEYFASPLFSELEVQRNHIREFAFNRYSWDKIAEKTRLIYEHLLQGGAGPLRPSAKSPTPGIREPEPNKRV